MYDAGLITVSAASLVMTDSHHSSNSGTSTCVIRGKITASARFPIEYCLLSAISVLTQRVSQMENLTLSA